MADNKDQPAIRQEEQHDLEGQQQALFDELSGEQVEAEQALPDDQEGSAGANSPQKRG